MKNILTEALVNSATNASFIFSYTNSAKLRALFFYFFCQIICFCISYYLVFCDIIVLGDIYACYNY